MALRGVPKGLFLEPADGTLSSAPDGPVNVF